MLGDFASLEELRTGLRASCSIPGITGPVAATAVGVRTVHQALAAHSELEPPLAPLVRLRLRVAA